MFDNIFFENLAIYKIILKNIVTPDHTIIGRMRNTCSITKATDTHSEHVIFLAFARQQWLRYRVSVLCYTCFYHGKKNTPECEFSCKFQPF